MCLMAKTQNIKQKQYCNKFHKDLKNGPHQEKHPQKTFFFLKEMLRKKILLGKLYFINCPQDIHHWRREASLTARLFGIQDQFQRARCPASVSPELLPISGRAPRENEDTGRRWWVVWILAAPAPMRVEQERKDKMDR